jgi:UDP-2-acetamido-2-deoxy-ribo-hexuluronate aminotransferase
MSPVMTQNIPMLDLKAQYAAIRDEIQTALNSVFESQQFILGPTLGKFEIEIAEFLGAGFAVGVASGTDALILALRAANVGPGDEVIVPGFSFLATAECASLLGATPVFADIVPQSFTLDPKSVVKKITGRTRAIIPVHLFGQAADMVPILELAAQHKLTVVEDNAQAIGATYKGRHTGTLGDFGCLSFFPSKNLGAWGDGGMIVTNSQEKTKRLRSLRNYGGTQKYMSDEIGWNSRLDEIQAAVLRVKLRHLKEWNRLRQAQAARYDSLLVNLPGLVIPPRADWGNHVFHQYTIRVRERHKVQNWLTQRGIASTVYYPVPLHLQPAYAFLGYKTGDLPESERAAAEVLSLPIYPELKAEQIAFIAEEIASALRA